MSEKLPEKFWELNVMKGKFPAHTAGFLNNFDSREFTPEQVAAREGGQNAIDAGRYMDGTTQLIFQQLKLNGEKKKQLVELYDFEEMLKDRIESFNKQSKNKHFVEDLKDFLYGDEIEALLIRDFNTCGLGGKFNSYEKEDHFSRLVCALNLDDKADDDSSSGGSFGLGKTAYAKSSKIRTVIYHTLFKPNPNEFSRRLMATGVYPIHELGETKYGGFAFYGTLNSTDKEEAIPFEGDDAIEIWKKTQEIFEVEFDRIDSQTGTDILILMNSLEFSDIKIAIEDYYFPAIYDKELEVKFIDHGGTVTFPNIEEREDISHFIKLMEFAKSGNNNSDESISVFEEDFNKKIKLGSYAFKALTPEENQLERKNCIAIMRNTGMVVNYLKLGSEQFDPAIGVFVANEDIHKYLVASENVAHSEWNENSNRLFQKYSDFGKKIIVRVNRSMKNKFLEFQKNLLTDDTQTQKETGLLARLLSGVLSGSIGKTSPSKKFNNLVSVQWKRMDRKQTRSVWSLTITDNEHTPGNPFKLKILPTINLSGENKKVRIKHMQFSVFDENSNFLIKRTNPEIETEFKIGTELKYRIEFENPGQRNYVVDCKCIVDTGE